MIQPFFGRPSALNAGPTSQFMQDKSIAEYNEMMMSKLHELPNPEPVH